MFQKERLPLVWFYGAVAICVFFVIASALRVLVEDAPALIEQLLSALTLRRENNPAAWWSGMLLAMASVHAFDGYVLCRRREPDLARAWALFAASLLILSADEVASVHERVGAMGVQLGIGQWLALLPFGLVLLAIFAWAVISMWRAGEQQRRLWFLLVGFLALGSAALYEHIGDTVGWRTEHARAAFP